MTNVEQLGKIPKHCAVGKNELLDWVNRICGVNYTKIEDCSNGAAFCQIMDAIYPGSVPLNHVNYDPLYENDVVNNFKILQESFYTNNIQKNLDIKEIIRKKASSALEIMQWLYNYSEYYGNIDAYDPYERRREEGCIEPRKSKQSNTPSPIHKHRDNVNFSPRRIRKSLNDVRSPDNKGSSGSDSEQKIGKLERKLDRLEKELMATTKEREFYWEKLRVIEIYCNEHKNESTKEILDLLYDLDSQGEFIHPDTQ